MIGGVIGRVRVVGRVRDDGEQSIAVPDEEGIDDGEDGEDI